MKVKVSEAKDAVLDWLVAKADQPVYSDKALIKALTAGSNGIGIEWDAFEPTTNWAQGGPIIERERISIDLFRDGWYAVRGAQEDHYYRDTPQAAGPTALVAAMRCYVASRLGEEVEVPDELA